MSVKYIEDKSHSVNMLNIIVFIQNHKRSCWLEMSELLSLKNWSFVSYLTYTEPELFHGEKDKSLTLKDDFEDWSVGGVSHCARSQSVEVVAWGERERERRGAPHISFRWEIGTFRVWNLIFTIHGAFCSEGSQWNAFLLSPLSTPTNCNRCHLGDSGS